MQYVLNTNTCNYWGSISSDYLVWACTFAARKPTSFGFGKVGMYEYVVTPASFRNVYYNLITVKYVHFVVVVAPEPARLV